jgi:hypothetical protein
VEKKWCGERETETENHYYSFSPHQNSHQNPHLPPPPHTQHTHLIPPFQIDCVFSSENNALIMSQSEKTVSAFLNTKSNGTIQKELFDLYKAPLEISPEKGAVAYTSAGDLSSKYLLKGVIHLVVVKRGVLGWISNTATPENVSDVFRKGLFLANQKGFVSVAVRYPFTAKSASTHEVLRAAMDKVLADENLMSTWGSISLRFVHLCQE